MPIPGSLSGRISSALGSAALALALLLSLAAGLRGARLREVALELGPGDGPFTTGFARPRPEAFDPYEIEGGTATHWTTHNARIALPLIVIDTRSLGVRLRFARHFADRGHLEVRLAGQEVARFEIGKGDADYDAAAKPLPGLPLTLDLAVHAQDERGLGVRLDRVQFLLAEGGRVRLALAAVGRLPLTVALVFALLLLARATPRLAGFFSLGLAAAGALGLLVDPWLTYRLLRGVPETLLLLAFPAMAGLRALGARAPASALPLAGSVLLFGFLLRAAPLNHPEFYNPDYRTHAGLVEVASKGGLDLLRSPASLLFTPRAAQASGDPLRRATSGLWLRRVGDQDVGLPYSILPHAALSLLPLDYDGRLAALRMTGAFFAALPAALSALLAARVGLSPWSALLVAAAPTGTAELALGSVPAVVGHAADLAFILLLALVPPRGARGIAGLALALAAAQLTYVSATLLLPVLVLALALLVSLLETQGWRTALRLLAILGAGSTLALVVYYRDFVPDALLAMHAALAPAGAGPLADPGRDLALSALRDWGFGAAPALGLVGLLWLVGRRARPDAPWILPAWGLAAVALGLLQGRFPGTLGFLHLPLFAATLVGLGAGGALWALARVGRPFAALAAAGGLLLVAHGFWLQWLALRAERLGL